MASMLLLLLLLLLLESASGQFTKNFSIHDDNFTGFITMGNEVIILGNGSTALNLTLGSRGGGRVFYPSQVQLLDATRNNRSVAFKTSFVFSIVGIPGEHGIADGMTMMMAPNLNQTINFNTSPNDYCLAFACPEGSSNNHMFGVEFDTYLNSPKSLEVTGKISAPTKDHIGIDINDVNSVHIADLDPEVSLRQNKTLQCWVEYTGEDNNTIMVWLAVYGTARPPTPNINFRLPVQLSKVILPSMYIGFSASSAGSVYRVFSWNFSANLNASDAPPKETVFPIIPVVASLVAALVLVVILAGAVFWWKRRQGRYRRTRNRERQVAAIVSAGSFPKFTFKELQVATKDFKERIGEGGSCKVYKGYLLVSGCPVAIKCFKNTVAVDMVEHQFLAELKVISQVKHHCLVGLKGWCYENKKVLLVYEFMSKGSLQKVLFSPMGCRLSWNHRYEIMRKVAEGLAYLHEGLERTIVHRDVKAGNILLDDRWNAKLGDFGWAKYLQGTETQTMTSVGTLGYISPELNRYGKATEKTDVYSYGILLLEIVTGQQAVSAGPDGENLLYRVKSSARRNELNQMVDPRVVGGEDFNLDEATKILQMGLLCCQPRPSQRPTMRQCCGILNGEMNLQTVAALLPRTTIERAEVSTSTLEDEDMVSEFSESDSSTYQTAPAGGQQIPEEAFAH